MKAFFGRQREVVLAKLKGPKARRGTRHWNGDGALLTKQIDPSAIFNLDDWNRQLRDVAKTILTEIFKEYGDDTAGSLNATFDIASPRVVEAILAQENRLVGVNDTTYEAIKSALASGEEAGLDINGIADLIAGVFSDAEGYRAKMIARTETLGAANGSAFAAALDAGAETKTWLSAQDDRVRGTKPTDEFDHVAADGEEVAVADAFTLTGEDMDYPGDPNGSPANTINCRCSIAFSTGVTTEGGGE